MAFEDVLADLKSSIDGLSQQEAEQRLKTVGLNQLPSAPRNSALMRFFLQFHNMLIYVLLGSAAIAVVLGHWVDSGVIVAVVFVNALIGFVQEGKAEKALDAIRSLMPHQATVRRDQKWIDLSAELLVPGDVVLLQSGDKVPADLRLFKARDLHVDEAVLTGESATAVKTSVAVQENTVIGDRECMAFSGTLVTYGQGQGVVIATADKTEIGHISGMVREVSTITTPLLRQMSVFSLWLSAAITVLSVVILLFGVIVQHYSWKEMFLAAVGFAVAGIPEGLPAIVTITLAIGVQRMARKKAIIRRLPAVETLGSVTVICSDKTGTLTHNEMTVQSLITADGVYEISGAGYNPHGTFTHDGEDVNVDDFSKSHVSLFEVARAALLCNDATLTRKEALWQLQGDPTEGALITLALKVGLEQYNAHSQYPRLDAIPFESQHRFMATLHHDHANNRFIYLKGAPEQVLAMCALQRQHGQQDKDLPLDVSYWTDRMHSLAERGMRLLALAQKKTDDSKQSLLHSDVQGGLTLLGIVGIADPPRAEAIQAINRCRQAGIKVKMITGDHSITASAIGRQMGIGDGNTVISGTDMQGFDEAQFQAAINACDVFARVSPEQKLQLVKALQSAGEVVAMTGDGVNDAPALKRADVGIAMGCKGTEAAKEASEMVLVDDNFASIAYAVEEGRTVYDNLTKSILFVLPTSGGEALTILAAILMGQLLPITAVQILWVNMVTAITLALTLAFEPPESRVMIRPPRPPQQPLLTAFVIWRIIFVSLILLIGTFGLFYWEQQRGADIDVARTIAVNTLVMFEIFYLLSARYLHTASLSIRRLRGNPYVFYAIALLLVVQLGFTYLPFMQSIFATTAIQLSEWARVVAVSASVLLLVEVEKWAFRLWRHHRKNRP